MDGFGGPLDLQLEQDPSGRPELREDRCLWTLIAPLSYRTKTGHLITVPAGFVTDLASIPQFAWSLGFAPDGPWAKAAVIHDYLYSTKGQGGVYTRAQADSILDEAMADLGVPGWRRAIIWAAVRVGGASGWG